MRLILARPRRVFPCRRGDYRGRVLPAGEYEAAYAENPYPTLAASGRWIVVCHRGDLLGGTEEGWLRKAGTILIPDEAGPAAAPANLEGEGDDERSPEGLSEAAGG
jgi:hypothetical protein